jgi:hypothetical protein
MEDTGTGIRRIGFEGEADSRLTAKEELSILTYLF